MARDTVWERQEERSRERQGKEQQLGKESEIGGTSIMIRGGRNRSVVIEVIVGNGVSRSQYFQWQGRCPMELGPMVSHLSQTVVSDP